MQIWFYKRDAQLGDYIFADGSYSDIYRKDKSVVGVCFYIDPENKSNRLCVATNCLPRISCWGLYPNDWPEGITLNDTITSDIFDVPGLSNISECGLPMAGGTSLITEEGLRDYVNGDKDGFKIFPKETGLADLGWNKTTLPYLDVPEGSYLPAGRINTLKIILYRNQILNDSNINLDVPHKTETQSEFENLYSLIDQIQQKNSNEAKYAEFYYPAASACYAYEPSVNRATLADKFKAGKWFLPSTGEIARIVYWHMKGYEKSNSEAIFAEAKLKGCCPELNHTFWASTEYRRQYAWQAAGSGNIGGNTKQDIATVLPVAAF